MRACTVKICTELVIWVWLNAINKLKSYLHSGPADMCVRSHVIALALSLGVPGKPCQLLTCTIAILRRVSACTTATLRRFESETF